MKSGLAQLQFEKVGALSTEVTEALLRLQELVAGLSEIPELDRRARAKVQAEMERIQNARGGRTRRG